MRRFTLAFALSSVAAPVPAQGRVEPKWESIDLRPTPAWFEDAKLGIFIHWGVYAVPSFAPRTEVSTYARYSEWYWKRLMTPDMEGHPEFKAFHDRVYGPGARYQDFAPQWKAELYDPAEWADVFERAGAKYVVLTSKHHDGFCLWPSRESWNWNAVDVGPHRDVAGDLVKAVRGKGLKMGFYYSLYEWMNPLYHEDVNRYVDTHMIPADEGPRGPVRAGRRVDGRRVGPPVLDLEGRGVPGLAVQRVEGGEDGRGQRPVGQGDAGEARRVLHDRVRPHPRQGRLGRGHPAPLGGVPRDRPLVRVQPGERRSPTTRARRSSWPCSWTR